jgi:hypothetical protein
MDSLWLVGYVQTQVKFMIKAFMRLPWPIQHELLPVQQHVLISKVLKTEGLRYWFDSLNFLGQSKIRQSRG